jgi:hypothetical protein
MLNFQFRQRVIAGTWRGAILAFPNIQRKKRISSQGRRNFLRVFFVLPAETRYNLAAKRLAQ